MFGIVALAYVGNFVLFYAFPSLCPRMTPELEALRTADYSGYFIASLTQYFQSEGAISGGCFPSTIPLNKHWQFAATFCLFAHPSSLVIL